MPDNVLAAFEHQPLERNVGCIRLLRVHKTLSPDVLVRCALTHSTITESSCILLLYVWGLPTPSQTILIDGRKLEVRQNLFGFMTHARTNTITSESTAFWIDAICIDQSNIPERNSQVAQMGDVYSKTQCILSRPGIITGLDAFARFCDTRGRELVESDGRTSRHADEEREALQPLKNSVWSQIVHNQYWSRAWIVQELFLPHQIRVLLGQKTIAFAELYMGLVYGFFGLHEANILQFRSLGRGVSRIRGRSFLQLVLDFYVKECMVPDDRFYSLYSL
jgi:hypothetical protein